MKKLSERLRKCAESRGVNQSEVAKACAIPTGSVSRYFTGASTPKARELYSLARYFGVSMEWLLVGDRARDRDALRVEEDAVAYRALRRERIEGILRDVEDLSERVRRLADED